MQRKESNENHTGLNVCMEHCTQPRIEGGLFAYILRSAENYPPMVCSTPNEYQKEL